MCGGAGSAGARILTADNASQHKDIRATGSKRICAQGTQMKARLKMASKIARPILFNAEMVRAILLGRKAQTRRIVKPQPPRNTKLSPGYIAIDAQSPSGFSWCSDMYGAIHLKCPYGKVGDRLWVMEPFRVMVIDDLCDQDRFVRGEYTRGGGFETSLTQAEWDKIIKWKKPYQGKSSLYMFKSLARLWLEVTGISVERVQEIYELEALAEGVEGERMVHGKLNGVEGDYIEGCARDGFQTLWDSINKKRGYGWDENPWVWVVEFRQLPGKDFW